MQSGLVSSDGTGSSAQKVQNLFSEGQSFTLDFCSRHVLTEPSCACTSNVSRRKLNCSPNFHNCQAWADERGRARLLVSARWMEGWVCETAPQRLRKAVIRPASQTCKHLRRAQIGHAGCFDFHAAPIQSRSRRGSAAHRAGKPTVSPSRRISGRIVRCFYR